MFAFDYIVGEFGRAGIYDEVGVRHAPSISSETDVRTLVSSLFVVP